MSQKENIFKFNHIDKGKQKKRYRKSKNCISIIITNIGVTDRPSNTLRN